MNFKQEMIKRLTREIDALIRSGKSKKEAIKEIKRDSIAGPNIWVEIRKMY